MIEEKETMQMIYTICLSKLEKQMEEYANNMNSVVVDIALYQTVIEATLLPLRYEA